MAIESRQLDLDGTPARFSMGGEGKPLVLIHGGWGGAAMHWSPVWELFIERGFRVVAPELPGIGAADQPGLPSLEACAAWLGRLLNRLGIGEAYLVGSSLGAAVAWTLALDAPERALGLVLVNGGPFPALPAPVRQIARRWPARLVIQEALRRFAYRPNLIPRAFRDPRLAPEGVRQVMSDPAPPQLGDIVELFVSGRPFSIPRTCILLVWGDADGLPGGSLASAEALHARLPGSRLQPIAGAGHLPQIEQPAAFVDAIVSFVDGAGGR